MHCPIIIPSSYDSSPFTFHMRMRRKGLGIQSALVRHHTEIQSYNHRLNMLDPTPRLPKTPQAVQPFALPSLLRIYQQPGKPCQTVTPCRLYLSTWRSVTLILASCIKSVGMSRGRSTSASNIHRPFFRPLPCNIIQTYLPTLLPYLQYSVLCSFIRP